MTASDLYGETNKRKLMIIWLMLLQHGTPKGNYQLNDIRIKSKLQGLYDFKKIRSCIDLIEDTEDAIIEFFSYQLSTSPLNERLGEKYLRLYGILNAVYLQYQAIIQLAELIKCPNKKAMETEFKNLKIIEARHIAAAHTVNFLPHSTSKFKVAEGTINTFRITQMDLKADGSSTTFVDAFGSYENINLKREVHIFVNKSDETLYEITVKYIKTLFKNNLNKREEFIAMVEQLNSKVSDYNLFNKSVDVMKEALEDAEKLLKEFQVKKHYKRKRT